MADGLDIVALEPYFGGSHAVFLDTLVRHSRHRITAVTLPARKWKWRMRGASLYFACQETTWLERDWDVIFATDMLSVADLRAMLPERHRATPIVCYFHENQLTYPSPHEKERDWHYGFTNLTSALAANEAWFNSRTHMKAFYEAAGKLLRRMPDHVPIRALTRARQQSSVMYPPVDVPLSTDATHTASGAVTAAAGGLGSGGFAAGVDGPARILWCHRWEHDKNPEAFFEIVRTLEARHVSFRLVLLGQRFADMSDAGLRVCEQFRHRIDLAEFIPDRSDYLRALAQCDVVVSTALQENFGIGVVEAILAGAWPMLPRRLSYPELIPTRFHETCLYDTDEMLADRLTEWLQGLRHPTPTDRAALVSDMAGRFSAPAACQAIDDGFERLANNNTRATDDSG